MWLLDTTSLELRRFNAPPDKQGDDRYAILSHVWNQSGEQSLQDIKRIVSRAKGRDPLLPQRRGSHPPVWDDSRLSAKIRDCCAFARSMGYRYVWIDSCCIDKTSSAELSEAINSMFQWYSRAAVCLAFLDDVDACEDPSAQGSAFRRSRWFTRGWTLQELLAPRDVLFLSKGWQMLGTKEDLADVIEDITGVDHGVLTMEQALHSVGVARRMSWASKRETTREEDEAYSLLGIFGICMPTIYGEGRNAFFRLQEEILRQIPDHSIFVWGTFPFPVIEDEDSNPEVDSRDDSIGDSEPLSYMTSSTPLIHWHETATDLHGRLFNSCSGIPTNTKQYLLAPSPRVFEHSSGISPVDVDTLQDLLGGRLLSLAIPHYTMTSCGVETRLPVIARDFGKSVAVLACQNERQQLIGLVLQKTPLAGQYAINTRTPDGLFSEDPCWPGVGNGRAVAIHKSRSWTTHLRSASQQTICIAHRPSASLRYDGCRADIPKRSGWDVENIFHGPCSIVIPQWNLSLLSSLGCLPGWPNPGSVILVKAAKDGLPSCTLAFHVPSRSGSSARILIHIALCPRRSRRAHEERWPLHATVSELSDRASPSTHPVSFSRCAEQHVAKWEGASRTWKLRCSSVTLKFRSWPCGEQTSESILQPVFSLQLDIQLR
ncbi:HET-domain-containing protein [Trametes cingulata]|nr:HET-domain-containing protein [Trametes cingulata]